MGDQANLTYGVRPSFAPANKGRLHFIIIFSLTSFTITLRFHGGCASNVLPSPTTTLTPSIWTRLLVNFDKILHFCSSLAFVKIFVSFLPSLYSAWFSILYIPCTQELDVKGNGIVAVYQQHNRKDKHKLYKNNTFFPFPKQGA